MSNNEEMNRSLGVERTFTLGQYKNIKVSDYISDIPMELMFNDEFIKHTRLLQLMKLDEVYFTYMKKSPLLAGVTDPEQALAMIDEIKSDTLEHLKEAIAETRDE